jgi:hypothetical protein
MRKTIAASAIALTMALGGMSAAAQLDKAWDATKHAGQSIGEATKDTGKAVVHGGKKAVGTSGTETKKETKSTMYRAKCADGTHQLAKTQKAATAGCGRHGGLAR